MDSSGRFESAIETARRRRDAARAGLVTGSPLTDWLDDGYSGMSVASPDQFGDYGGIPDTGAGDSGDSGSAGGTTGGVAQ